MLSNEIKEYLKDRTYYLPVGLHDDYVRTIIPKIEAQEALIKEMITQFEKYKKEFFCSHKRQVCQYTCGLNFDKNDCFCLISDSIIQEAKEIIK